MTRRSSGSPSPREAGLRWLAASGSERATTLLYRAFTEPNTVKHSKKVEAVRDLVQGVAQSFPAEIRVDQYGPAVWRLIEDEVARTGPREHRMALVAALQLDSSNPGPNIDSRLAFARDRGDFDNRGDRTPGYDALRRWWGDGVRSLAHAMDERVREMWKNSADWLPYLSDVRTEQLRAPFPSAQPVFIEMFITTVYMKRRGVQRRITERLVTARDDNVQYYTAWALPEMTALSSAVPVRALWGCAAETLPSQPGEPILTRLWFPQPLHRGETHYLASEALVENPAGDRRAINVEVDSYGIAAGRRVHEAFPISGLTIRIRFDETHMPAAVWWYADVSERERYLQPATDDRSLVVSSQGEVEHTFTDPCQPRGNYGLSFRWPASKQLD